MGYLFYLFSRGKTDGGNQGPGWTLTQNSTAEGVELYIWSYVLSGTPARSQTNRNCHFVLSHHSKVNGAKSNTASTAWSSSEMRTRMRMTAITVHQWASLLSRRSPRGRSWRRRRGVRQDWGGRYCLSSRAQTCWGHPVRPLLFLSAADEADDEEDDEDEVVLGISTCGHMTCIIYIAHCDSCTHHLYMGYCINKIEKIDGFYFSVSVGLHSVNKLYAG